MKRFPCTWFHWPFCKTGKSFFMFYCTSEAGFFERYMFYSNMFIYTHPRPFHCLHTLLIAVQNLQAYCCSWRTSACQVNTLMKNSQHRLLTEGNICFWTSYKSLFSDVPKCVHIFQKRLTMSSSVLHRDINCCLSAQFCLLKEQCLFSGKFNMSTKLSPFVYMKQRLRSGQWCCCIVY